MGVHQRATRRHEIVRRHSQGAGSGTRSWWKSRPTANPPVCKIVDFGKFRYDISKQEKDKKTSGTKLKEIKFRVNIDDHDYLTKIRHGEAVSRQREQGPGAAAIPRPGNGAPGIRDAADVQSARRSRRHVAGGDGTEDCRPQHHHDAVAVAGGARKRRFSVEADDAGAEAANEQDNNGAADDEDES